MMTDDLLATNQKSVHAKNVNWLSSLADCHVDSYDRATGIREEQHDSSRHIAPEDLSCRLVPTRSFVNRH